MGMVVLTNFMNRIEEARFSEDHTTSPHPGAIVPR